MSAGPLSVQDVIEVKRMALRIKKRRAELGWREWLGRYFPTATSAPFAPHHIQFWEWLGGITPGTSRRPFIACWPRGGGKSSTVELGCAWLGSRANPVRKFVLYVCEVQAQADRHVQTIGSMLERVGASRSVNEYGQSKGWRHSELRAANGFNVVAMGLDSAMRGAKLDEFRPDLIVFDDIDGRHDTAATVGKKIDTITTSILPTGSVDASVVVVQNKIHEDSIMAQLLDGRADFLHDRLPAEAIPAVRGLEIEQEITPDGTRYRIVGGTATWAGQSLQVCENQITKWGLSAFLREAQHEVESVSGGLWNRERDIVPFRVTAVPDLDRIVVAVDPNAGGSDEAGIVVAGISNLIFDRDIRSFRYTDLPHGYVLEDATVDGGPKVWAEAAVAAYHKYRADALVAEKNNGGEMVAITIGTVPGAPSVDLVWASRGKITRAEPVQKLYSDGRVHHVGMLTRLEHEMCTWKPPMPSPNRMDACFVAGTMVLTDRGYLPIEHVRVGDLAMTRDGWHPVTHHGLTNAAADVMTVEFSDGRVLTGTPNHPVFTENRGFVPLETIGSSDEIVTDDRYTGGDKWVATKTSSSSMALHSSVIPTVRPVRPGGTSTPIAAASGLRVWGRSIVRYGSPFTARFLRAIRSTILMGILSTITSGISSAFLPLNTQRDMQRSFTNSGQNMPIGYGHSHQSGIVALKGESGIEHTEGRAGKDEVESIRLRATTAARVSRASTNEMEGSQGIAVANAVVLPLMPKADTQESRDAQSVGSSSSRTSIERNHRHARAYVVRSYASGTAPVYNLEVQDHPEYFANGILVHNCVWAITDLMVEDEGDYSDLDNYYASQGVR